ncbi:Uncharacterised protein [Candidatus Burarchaeum australiense]|nr:Uncharacterised protein [Candidatus Burarchaeum australiense]
MAFVDCLPKFEKLIEVLFATHARSTVPATALKLSIRPLELPSMKIWVADGDRKLVFFIWRPVVAFM